MNLAGELRVAMVVYGDIALDSRVQREANSLAQAGHAVTIFCLSGSHADAPMLDRRVDVIARAADSVRRGPKPLAPSTRVQVDRAFERLATGPDGC